MRPHLLLLTLLPACWSTTKDSGAPDDSATAGDRDGDGSPDEEDCAPDDATVYPGAAEAWYDGVDGDCAGDDDYDQDGDGARDETGGGLDCDDTDAAVGPPVWGTDCARPYADCTTEGAMVIVPDDVPTVQAAIDAASDGTVICVAPGTATGLVDFGGKAVSVIGPLGSAYSTLAGGGDGPVVTMQTEEPEGALLQGLTITDGHSPADAGGVWLYTDTELRATLRDLVVNNNRSDDDGGGMYVHRTSAVLEDVTLSNNEPADSGGGLRIVESNASFDGLVVTGNHAPGTGGGIAVRNGQPRFVNVLVSDNVADSNGGGIVALEADATFTNLLVTGNTGLRGGGAYLINGTTSITDGVFLDNHGSEGGGIAAAESWAGEIVATVVGGNDATGTGGGVALLGVCGATMSNLTVAGNEGDCGGVSVVEGCSDGAQVPALRNSSITNNEGPNGGGVCSVDGGELSTAWSNVWGNSENWVGLPDLTGTSGLISREPGYLSFSRAMPPESWELHLRPTSPLRDAGDTTLTDADGSRADMGAFGGPAANADWYADGDTDGLYDGWEQRYGTDPAAQDSDADPDGDGLDNVTEMLTGTDPNDADTDGDGRSDGDEKDAGQDPLDPAA